MGGSTWDGIPSDRVVGVVASLDTGQVQIGSGYLVTERLVLTARHCVFDYKTSREVTKLRVARRAGGPEASATLLAAGSELDVAVLAVEGPPWAVPVGSDPPRFGRVDRSRSRELGDCQAIGFPLWQLDPQDQGRNAAELHGTIRATEDAEAGLLVMRDPELSDVAIPGTVAADDRADRSPWGGLSGALVFCQGLALGVVIEHRPWQGGSAITILPVERFAAAPMGGNADIAAVAAALGLPPADELPLAGSVQDERHVALRHAYQAVLDRAILPPEGLPEGVNAPTLGAVYVDPEFRVAEAEKAERFAEESWWADKPVQDDLLRFLAEQHLACPQAVKAPLLVLGQPGSGKSVLTQVLAARLPPSEFLVVRVILRDVAADADLQTQIEDAIRAATGENLAWPDLARSSGAARPVVLLDGFDELLQATGASQTYYLKKIADFQTREADLGRSTAVLVTSRSAVADRALPAAGMIVIRLEHFRDTHIARWLQVWNDANAAGFAKRGLQPLPLEVVLAHPELAAQPLLLLMLALYDADGNRLQRDDASLSTADLYEQLLTGFAAREVDRTGAALAAEDLREAAEDELLLLSVAAFAMFNRGRQWVTEAGLNKDLLALELSPRDRGSLARQPGSTELVAQLSAAQVTLGRFFFIHESQATREGARLRTYEFLHPTFGEYLIARMLVRECSDLASAAISSRRNRPAPPDDAFVHAVTSFMPLSMRGTVISFLAERLQALPAERRDQLGTIILTLFREALYPRFGGRYSDYMPQELPVTARHAAWSANLLMLAVLVRGEARGGDLFPDARDPVEDWSKLALLWRSQLPPEGWSGLIDTIIAQRAWGNEEREIILRARHPAESKGWLYDPYWTRNLGPQHEYRPRRRGNYSNWVHLDYVALREQVRFIADPADDAFAHALEPLADLGTAVTSFHGYWHDRSISAANALIMLWLASNQDTAPDELAAAYDTCLLIAISGFAPSDTETRRRFREIFLRQLARDRLRVPQAWLTAAAEEIREAAERGSEGWSQDGAALLEMATEVLPDLMTYDTRNT